jgi:hypothetical protein
MTLATYFSRRELATRLALPHKLHHGPRSGGFGDLGRHPDVAVWSRPEMNYKHDLLVVRVAWFRELLIAETFVSTIVGRPKRVLAASSAVAASDPGRPLGFTGKPGDQGTSADTRTQGLPGPIWEAGCCDSHSTPESTPGGRDKPDRTTVRPLHAACGAAAWLDNHFEPLGRPDGQDKRFGTIAPPQLEEAEASGEPDSRRASGRRRDCWDKPGRKQRPRLVEPLREK